MAVFVRMTIMVAEWWLGLNSYPTTGVVRIVRRAMTRTLLLPLMLPDNHRHHRGVVDYGKIMYNNYVYHVHRIPTKNDEHPIIKTTTTIVLIRQQQQQQPPPLLPLTFKLVITISSEFYNWQGSSNLKRV
jgi:hypothetical protein